MQVQTVYTSWFVLFMILAVIGAVVFAFKHRRQPLVALLFAVGMGALLIGSLLGVSKQSRPQAIVVSPSMNTAPSVEPGSPVPTTPPVADPALDALWDKLTKSKINLDADAIEPATDAADEKVKDADKDTLTGVDGVKSPPKWVLTSPKWIGQVYRETVSSEPFVTEEECRRNLEQVRLPEAVARRIETVASGKAGGTLTVTDPLKFGIGPDYILREIGREEFTTTLNSSVGEMKEVHVLLEFDKNVDNYLLDAWLRHERQLRFASLSKFAALSLTGLAAVYGLLRFDTWSKGYYSRQLLVGGTLAIIALAVFVLRVS